MSMKSTRRSMFFQGGLLALVLLVLLYMSWQRYRQPNSRAYQDKMLNQWLEYLNDPDYRISDQAADTLVQMGVSSVPLLLEACQQGPVRLHRRAAATLLRLGAAAAPGLAAALKDKTLEPRLEVVLVRLGPAAVPALREALAEEKSSQAAAHILGLIGPRAADAVPDLIAVLNRLQMPVELRSEVIFALGRIGEGSGQSEVGSPPFTSDIVSALIVALQDPQREIRERAAEALGWIGGAAQEAVPALIAALKDEETKVATKACQALSFIGEERAAPALLAAFQDSRPEVAAEAGQALWLLGAKADSVVPALLSAAAGPREKSAPARGLLALFGPRIVPVLVKALGDPEATRREAAADVLGRIGPPARAAVPALITALQDKSSSVALVAAMALAEIDPTRSSPAVKILADALDVPGAALALAKIGPEARAAVPALIAALKPRGKTVEQEQIRLHARLALARIGPPAVPALIEALKDTREGVAPLAAEALGWVLPPPKEAVPALRTALRNDRAHAAVYAHALGQLGPLAQSAVPELRDLLADAPSRAAVAVALGRIDPQQVKKTIPQLIQDLQADEEQQRQRAVLALAHLGAAAQPAAEALIALLRERLLTETEIIALREVWTTALPALVDLLKSPEVECRRRAVFALGQTGSAAQTVLQPLILALADRDDAVRIGVAQILQAIGPPASQAVPALVANLQARAAEVRAAAAAALGHIEAGAKEACQPLWECLLDPDEQVRYAATLSLGRIDPHFTQAVPALRDALNDPAPMVRLAAIDSLSHIDPAVSKDAVPVLVALSRQPYPLAVRFRAVEGITHIMGPQIAKKAASWLTKELTDVVPENRLWAARLLAKIEPERSAELVLALAAALPTPLADRRPAILQTLGEFGPKAREVVPEIEHWLYDHTPAVRPEAIQALRAIAPAHLKSFGLD